MINVSLQFDIPHPIAASRYILLRALLTLKNE